jgi:type I restriction enzyme S subunit
MKKPTLRFKEFDGEWGDCELGKIITSFSGGTPTAGCAEYYNGSIPFIRSGEINSSETELFITPKGLDNSSAKLVEKGDILYALYGATSGEVGRSKINGAINQAILAIRPVKGFDSNFMAFWLRKSKKSIIDTYLQGGQGNLSGEIVKKLVYSYPLNNAEQKAIGSFFSELDALIEGKRVKLDKLKKLKLAYLGKMFPKKGVRVPEVRFKGFYGDWDAVPFDKVMTFLSNNTLSRADLNYVDGDVQNVHYGDVLIKLGEVLDLTKEKLPFINAEHDFSKLSSSMLKDGDIVIADTAEDETAGKCTEIRNIENKKVVAGLHTMPCRPNMNFASGYLGYYMNSPSYHSQLLKYMQGTKVVSISKSALANTVLSCPKDKVEQQKIGAFFQNLDNLINLQQQELDKLSNIKSACLSKMFA